MCSYLDAINSIASDTKDLPYFEVDHGRLKYFVQLTSILTIVSDNSGTGKTLLWDILRKYPGNRAKVKSNKRVVAIEMFCEITEDDNIFIIDEASECFTKAYISRFKDRLQTGKGCFVVLSRDAVFEDVAYSADDIKVLQSSNGIIRAVNKYQIFYKSGVPLTQHYFTEDSGSGNYFMSRLFGDVETTDGISNWEAAFKKLPETTTYFFDRCGCGSKN